MLWDDSDDLCEESDDEEEAKEGEDAMVADDVESGARDDGVNETGGAKLDERLNSSLRLGDRSPAMPHRVVIRDFAPSTVRAFVHFLLSGQIDFAPLSSICDGARASAIAQHQASFPKRPPPVSAKSIFRIADKCARPCRFALTMR